MIYAMLIIIIIMTVMGSFGGFFLKRASAGLKFPDILKNYNLYLGGIFYVGGAVLNIYVLRFLDYSLVLPLTSLTYIWTMAISYKLLGEKITCRKILGVVLIVSGAVVMVMA